MYQEILKKYLDEFHCLVKAEWNWSQRQSWQPYWDFRKARGMERKAHTTMDILFSGGVQDYHFPVDKDHVSSTLLWNTQC